MYRQLLFVFPVLAACSAAGVDIGVQVAGTQSTGQALSSDPSTSADADSTPGAGSCDVGGGLKIDRVRILLREAKLGGGGPVGDGQEAGPFVIELTGCELLTGVTRTVASADFSAGSYSGGEIEIEPVGAEEKQCPRRALLGLGSDDDDAADLASRPELADFLAQKASVLVDGSYHGVAFSFPARFKAEQHFTDAVEVTADAAVPFNLAVNPAGWFRDASGAVIDPSVAENHDAIAKTLCLGLDDGKHRGEGEPAAMPAEGQGMGGGRHGKAGGGRGHGGPHRGGMRTCVEPPAP